MNMGRHHVKLPNHLYISPSPSPSQSPSSFTFASTLFFSKSGFRYGSRSLFLDSISTTRTFERHIPGFKTSATFLAALRANIDLQVDSPESPANTPNSLHPQTLSSSNTPLLPPSPLSKAMSTSNSYTDADLAPPPALQLPKSSISEDEEPADTATKDPNAIPELTNFPAKDDASRVEALRLVADSVAQQRQRASRALIFHPLTIGVVAIAFAVLRQYFYKGQRSDYAIIGTTLIGIIMAILVGIRARTGAYIDEAERVGTWKWLAQGRSNAAEKETGKKILGDRDDEILITKFGDEHIGTIVFRGVQLVDESTSSTKKQSRKTSPGSQPKTEIRAWTVRQRYRGKGVGTALLEDAIRLAHERGWAQGGIEVAADHANHLVVVPSMLSGFVQANNERTIKYIEQKVREHNEATGSGKEKRRR